MSHHDAFRLLKPRTSNEMHYFFPREKLLCVSLLTIHVLLLTPYLIFRMLYFVIGACAAFLYDAYRPAEKSSGRWWGFIADMCTLAVIVWSICLVSACFNCHSCFYQFNRPCDKFLILLSSHSRLHKETLDTFWIRTSTFALLKPTILLTHQQSTEYGTTFAADFSHP